MPASKISDSEWEVMEVLWVRSPQSSTDVVSTLQTSTSWSPTTIRTLLTRLARKKILAAHKENGVLFYHPLLAKGDCIRAATESFIERILGGSVQPLMAHFVERGKLKPQDLTELKRLIREAEKKRL
jgi:BlaI family penicillinase repressor